METTQEALCPTCERPLPRTGAVCRYCRDRSPGGFHVRPLFLALVLILAAAFGAATVFANRFYQAKQKQLGQMWFGRGQAALAAGQPQPAVQDFRNALYYSHDDPAYRLRLAQALVAANRVPEAQSYLVTLWQDEPSNSTVNLELARLAARQGETQRALRYYHGAIYGLWPDGNVAAQRQQTRLELIRFLLGLRDATQADSELIALTPELPRIAIAHAQVGALFLQAGDPERALQEFAEALRLNPRQPVALRGAGEAAFQLGRYLEAAQYLDRARRAGLSDPNSEQLLATSRLVLDWNPYAKGLNSRQRAARIVQAFTRARRRLAQCAALRGVALTPAQQTPAAPAKPVPAPAPQNNVSGLMARILGKIKPGENGSSQAVPAPGNSNPSAILQLQQQVTQVRRGMRADKLERDPQLADFAMGLVSQIETITAQQCGPPKGPDLALLLLAHQAEER